MGNRNREHYCGLIEAKKECRSLPKRVNLECCDRGSDLFVLLPATISTQNVMLNRKIDDDMYPDIRKAANLAGFPNIRLSKNPIATALNYDFLKMDKHSGKEAINLLVVDLGMSLDLTIMEEEEPSIFDILAVKRIAVGGKTFNRNLAQLLGKKLGSGHFETMEAEGMIEETKRQLSARSRVDIEIGNRKTTITRQEFEEANSEVFEEILGHIDKFLEQNNFTAANIDEVRKVVNSCQ